MHEPGKLKEAPEPVTGERDPVSLQCTLAYCSMRRGLRLRRQRQAHREAGAAAGVAVDVDGAAVGFDDLAHDPQPQPEAAEMLDRRHPLEALEDAPLRLLGNADAMIGHAQQRTVALAADLDLDG